MFSEDMFNLVFITLYGVHCFPQRVWYSVNCTIYCTHSGELSFVITPPFGHLQRKPLFWYLQNSKLHQILMKQFHLITLHNDVRCSVFKHWSKQYWFMHARSQTVFLAFYAIRLGLYGVDWDDNSTWSRQWLGRVQYSEWEWVLCTEFPPRFTSSFVQFFLAILFSIL